MGRDGEVSRVDLADGIDQDPTIGARLGLGSDSTIWEVERVFKLVHVRMACA